MTPTPATPAAAIRAVTIRRKRAVAASEASWATVVEGWLDLHGWTWWHVPDSRRMRPGLLDYVALRPPRVVIFDIKVPGGRLEPEQADTLALLHRCPGVEAGVFWLPDDWPALRDMLAIGALTGGRVDSREREIG